MMNHRVLRSADKIVNRPAEHFRRGRVNERDTPIDTDAAYAFTDGFENGFNHSVRRVGIRPETGWKRRGILSIT